MSWVKEFRSFAGETSAHGVRNIFEGPNKFVKILFLVAWIAATIYSCYIIITSIVTFINKPTGTKYEVIIDAELDGKPQVIKFPTISVCTKNKVKRSFLESSGNDLLLEYFNIVDTYSMKTLAETKLSDRFDDPNDEMQRIADMTYEELIALGSPADDRMLMCSQRGKMCHSLPELALQPFYVREMSITGNCWRINPDGKIYGKAGDWGAMRLIFWSDIQDYALRSGDTPSYGFIVAFHDNTTYGSTLNSGFAMSPGTNYKVDLSLKQEAREPPPGGICNESLTDTSYGAYNEGACVMECKDRYLYDKCGCVNIKPPRNESASTHVYNYRSCTLKEWVQCGLKNYLDWANEYKDPNQTEDSCSCSTACKEIRYNAQVSSSSISPAYASNLATSPRIQAIMESFGVPELNISYSGATAIKENVMVIDISFTTMSISEVRQVVTYTKNNLLGDIGGVLGLFLGASLFTIIEFFQFLLCAVGKHCFGTGGGDEGGKEEESEKLKNEEAL